MTNLNQNELSLISGGERYRYGCYFNDSLSKTISFSIEKNSRGEGRASAKYSCCFKKKADEWIFELEAIRYC